LSLFENRQGGVARLLSVMFQGLWGSEYRHDAVPGDSVDDAAIVVHRLSHLSGGPAENFVDALRIQAGSQGD
jgi:hypothetical protein